MKKYKLYLFYLTVLLSFFCIDNEIYAQSEFEVTIDIIDSPFRAAEEGFVEGLFTVSYIPGNENTFLSIGAEDASTFLFEIIISNLDLPSISIVGEGRHTISQRFNFFPLFLNGNPPTMLTCYIHVLEGTGFYPFEQSTWLDTKEVMVNEIIDNAIGVVIEDNSLPNIQPVSPKEHIVDDPQLFFRNRTKQSFNIELDNSANGIVNDYAGDLNACVPTATANSMLWLNSAYNDITLPENLTPRETLKELSKFMKRGNGEGCTDQQMISGKVDFIDEYKLPIEVKFQSEFIDGNIASTSGNSIARNFNAENKKPTWEFFRKMMMDGEDVEINYKWFNADSNRWYAHSVNVTGFAEYTSGKRKIQIEHDLNQSGNGGTTLELLEINESASGWLYFSRSPNQPKIIRTVVAESPIIAEGRETAAWLNELFVNNNDALNKTNAGPEFHIEIALNESVTDLENYQVHVYNGETGLFDSAVSLNDFSLGTPSNGIMLYTNTLNIPENSNNHFGIGITYSGSIVGTQFLSIGGEFIGINGDATQMVSTDIGTISSGTGLGLAGFGETYGAYNWITTTEFTNGIINSNQSYTNSLPSVPMLKEPVNDGNELQTNMTFVWNSSQFANSYILEIATDEAYANVIYLNMDINDTTQTVENLISSQIYYWRISAVNGNGSSDFSEIWNFTTIVTDVDNLAEIPSEFYISQNYPNPFNPSTTIRYSIPANSLVKSGVGGSLVQLKIYDLLGKEIRTLVNQVQDAGNYEVALDGSDLTSGVYYYKIKAGEFTETRKMMLVK